MLLSFFLVVGIPVLVAGFYYVYVASDIYVSETRYAIRSGNEAAPSGGILSSVVGASAGAGPSSNSDSLIVRDYLLSRDMLMALQERLDLRAHYSSDRIDWFRRMSPDATEEDFLEYYRKMLEVSIEATSGVTVLKVRAFDPESAQTIARHMIELSEELVNQLSDRITEDTLRFARRELDIAESLVRDAGEAVTQFRSQSRSIDPGEETAAVLGIVTELESQLAAAQAELLAAKSFMRADSPKVKTIAARVKALERQVEAQRSRLAGEGGTDLTRLIDDYAPLVLDQKLSEQRYTSALSSLEVARAEAQRKQRYLVAFVSPELPDEALEPTRVKSVLTVFIAALMIYGIGGLIASAIKDHMGL